MDYNKVGESGKRDCPPCEAHLTFCQKQEN